jgi:hypothetical protein
MPDLGWLDRIVLQSEQVAVATAFRMRAAGTAIELMGAGARAAIEGREAAVETRPRPTLDVQRIEDCIYLGRTDELSNREARYACALFDVFAPQELLPLLRARRSGWRELLTACLREYERFQASKLRSQWIGAFAEAPVEAIRPRVDMSVQLLLGAGGATAVARLFAAERDPEAFGTQLVEAGFSWRWEFTSHVASQWFQRRRTEWPELIRKLVGPVHRALLPGPPGGPATGMRTSLNVHAETVAAVIPQIVSGELPEETTGPLIAELFKSTFGDPRIPPLTEGWLLVSRGAPESFSQLMRRLLGNDLRLFFRLVHGAEDRLEFWESYLPRLRGTSCLLDAGWFETVRLALIGSSDPAAQSTLARVHKAKQGPPAFCLFFDDIVVVEFSQVGNAAYIYPRSSFEAEFARALRTQFGDTTGLKTPGQSRNWKILHASGWQWRARERLEACEEAVRRAEAEA